MERLFPGFDRSRAPKPQDPATFTKSKLQWDERAREPHTGVLRLYTDLLALRRSYPALRSCERASFTAEAIGDNALALSWTGLLAIANLRGRIALDLKSSRTPLLDTEDLKYGGRGGAQLTGGTHLEMHGPGVVLLE